MSRSDLYDHLDAVWAGLTAPGQPFEINTLPIRGNPTRVFAEGPATLRDVWLASTPFAERDYLVYEDERWSYARAHAEVASLCQWLIDQGVAPGDRVALALRNYPEWLLGYWATLCAGATVVGMNAWWVGPEMVYAIEDAQPKVLIGDAERLTRLAEQSAEIGALKVVAVRCEADVFPGAVDFAETISAPAELPAIDIDPESDACIFYTSGTTGRPKGAQQTHRGCVNNIMNLAFAAAMNAGVAERMGQPIPDPESLPIPAALVTTPLFHVTANNCVAHPMTLNGGKLVCMYRWDAGQALELVEREKITALTGVPVMAREIISHPDFDKYDTSTLASMGGGGAQLQPDLVGKIDESVKTARPQTGYGMTETCGIITSIAGDFFIDKPESCGRAMPNFEAKVVDDEGNELQQGAVGELWVRGGSVIKGYLNREDATAETITDGWLHTGDVARIDERGFIFIVDRKKDMVLRGGENVYCAEVESALFDHSEVTECTVFGVPDDRLGEEVGAAVVLKDGARLSAEDLRAHCAGQIAKHKVPRYIWVLDQPLPRNASGKFLKRELRENLKVADAA
ncbi:MAG: class I adenylate-forming enzyme family protein [Pseudomonadota bacterium]